MLNKYYLFLKNTELWQALPIHVYTLIFIALSGELGPVNYENFSTGEVIKLVYYITGSMSAVNTFVIFFFDIKTSFNLLFKNGDKK